MSSCREQIIVEVLKGFLRRKTYFPVLGLHRRLVETLIAAEPPDGMV